MHRLFWKVFLSVWAALILFAAIVILVASQLVDRSRAEERPGDPRARLARYLVEAQRAADAGGVEALREWLETVDRRDALPIFLVDRVGEDLLARPLPGFLAERLERGARRREARERERRPRPPRGLVRVGGAEYRLVPHFQGVTLGRILRRPRVVAMPLVVGALVAGLVGVLLTRSLTAPLGRLRQAAERVAAGDLDHRVVPSLGRRRDEIAELGRAFDHMAGQIGALVGTQRQLIRDISHELRSPLARLQAALDLARQRTGDAAPEELDRIERETERLNGLIGQLLALAKLESGNETLDAECLDLAAVLAVIAEDAAFEARTTRRDVRIVSSEPAPVLADARLLRQALENVIRNAVKYTAEGTAVDVSLGRAAEDDGFVVEVRDRGPGVPGEMLGRLFDPFVRVGDARDRASGGFGLGLAIAEQSIRAHGGTISARNAADGGLAVTIAVPAAPVKPRRAPEA